MLRDARDTSVNGVLETDVCIIGSGPAGLTLAKEFSRSDRRILLLESGGETESEAESELNEGTVDSPQGYPANVLLEGRRRQVGGSANLWNHEPRGQKDKFIRCLPLDELDFEKRDWLPNSGWPFPRSELVPFYERAHRAFRIGPFDYSPDAWAKNADRGCPLHTSSLESSVSQFALPQHFLNDAMDEMKGSGRVSILTYANLLSLERDFLTNRILSAEAEAADGKKIRIKARLFVLAAGGLENPRILLLNQTAQEGGLGNQNDMVGRCFMDHPSITLGTLIPRSPEFFENADFYDQHLVEGQQVMGKLQLRLEVMRREKLLHLYSVLVPRFRNLHSNLPLIFKELLVKGPQFLLRKRSFPRRLQTSGHLPETPLPIRQRLLEGYFSECYCGWSRLPNKSRRFAEFGVRSLVELSPDPANRVLLGDELDRLGQRKMKIVWRWNENDLRSIRRTQEIFQSELALAGIGKFVPVPEGEKEFPRAFYSTHHFMGTTRMHHDPKQGVVDAHCKVHGLENLFIAGSSVFPTGGCTNPTLTIVALAIRLADHLQEQFPGNA